ncbi:MAG: metallophosphoesterase [Actinomycetota bacterium]
MACDTEDPFLRDGRGTAGHCAQHRTAELVEELNPDAVLGLGDLQNDDGTLAKFREVYDDSWGRFKDITYPAIGNHEYWSGSPDGYFDYWKQRAGARDKGWYMVRVGEWEIYALNANCAYPFFRSPSCEPGSEQWTWLRDRLRTSEATCQLAMWHEPRFSSGPHGPYGRLEPLWRLLVDARVELVLSAHDETYERFAPLGVGGRRDPEGVRQFVVGTGGDQLYEFDRAQPGSQVRGEGSFGVLELTLEPDAYGWRFRGIGPERVRDAGSAGCLA